MLWVEFWVRLILALMLGCVIGFLGAGVIMRDGLSVRGLNAAAGLW